MAINKQNFEFFKGEKEKNEQAFQTVGELKKFIEMNNISDDSPIFVERVEDVYFEKYNWPILLKEDALIDYDKDEYKNQYHPVDHSICGVENGTNVLFLKLHY